MLEMVTRLEPALWERATRHSFLRDVGTGRADAFEVWLGQDALFVADLIEFQARLVARAPRPARRVLAEGVVGLISELDWFDDQAGALGFSAAAAPREPTRAYRELLRQLDAEPYGVAVAALWLIERVYLEAWRYAASCGTGGPYAAAITHWTEPGFVDYVAALEGHAAGSHRPDVGTAEVLRRVLEREAAFWDMT